MRKQNKNIKRETERAISEEGRWTERTKERARERERERYLMRDAEKREARERERER